MLRHNIARPSDGRSTPHIPGPAPWDLLRLLPTQLSSLPDTLRGQLGPALDRGAVRLVLDDGGSALVLRGARP